MLKRAVLSVLVFALVACGGSSEGGFDPGLHGAPLVPKVVPAFPNLSFTAPVFVTAVPGSNLLAVVEQAGVVRTFLDVDSTSTTSVLLDIQDRVRDGGELGLLGLAFDPGFATNRFLYVNYTADGPLRTVIARFTVTAGVADPASEVVLLEYAQPYRNHNGGWIGFGPDGMLYVASGDGGSGNDPQDNGQRLDTLLGKVLRIRTTPGAIVPPDNPFVSTPGARGEIWAYGLRNPWRMSFDRVSGRLWIADVGQDAREEIDVGQAGGNYGWRVYEGTRSNLNPSNLPASGFIAPVHEYDHDQGQSITGGYAYRGTAMPSLAGSYFYADFVNGRLWFLWPSSANGYSNQAVATVSNPSSFGETATGELLIVQYGGTLLRIVP